jgi:hypothetical protein
LFEAAKELLKVGLRSIGVAKTATQQYPMVFLGAKQMGEKGDCFGLLAKNKVTDNNYSYIAYL